MPKIVLSNSAVLKSPYFSRIDIRKHSVDSGKIILPLKSKKEKLPASLSQKSMPDIIAFSTEQKKRKAAPSLVESLL